ncbi:MAG TPA: M1 family aminopeptidase [Usitatibacter sp.]|nr:M1 family aminopeptidase [Usitatibacter sp.]
MRALDIAAFELRSRMRLVSTHAYFAIFAAIAALWMAAAGGAFAGAKIGFSSDKVFVNAPFALAQTISILGFFGVVIVAAMMGRAVQQDFEYQSFHFFFTSPITKRDYFLGRFAGALGALVYVFAGIAAGILLGTHWPGVEASRIGPWSARAFLQPYLVLLVPNMVIFGSVFFGLAALTRRMMPVYVAGVVVLIGWLAATSLTSDLENYTVAGLVDPIGSIAMGNMTRYWSVSEKNTLLIPLAGNLLSNRLLWLALGLSILALCYWRFSMAYASAERARRGAAPRGQEMVGRMPVATPLPTVTRHLSQADALRELPAMVRLYTRETMKNAYFIVIVLAGALFVFANATTLGSIYGTTTYPVTYQVIDLVSGLFRLFILVVTALYAGELVWRERDANMAQLTDSLPTPTWLPLVAKLLTLFAILAVMEAVVMACGIILQLGYGYTKLEIGQYLYRLFLLQLPDYWILACLAFFIHVVVNNKYLGHFIVIFYWIASVSAALLGYDHLLYRFGTMTPVPYSDMNGYGNFVPAHRWLELYWGSAALLLVLAARLLWVRGVGAAMRERLRVARGRLNFPMKSSLAAAAVVMIATGGWIFYNIDVLNTYRTDFEQDELRATYEKSFKPLAAKPQPKIAAVTVGVDIYPHQHRIRYKGQYRLANRTAEAIPEIYMDLSDEADIHSLTPSIAWKEVESQPSLGWHRFALSQPLAAGAQMTLDFDIEYAAHGFKGDGPSRRVVDNGTFVNSMSLPRIGYLDIYELSEDRDRTRHGLKPKPRMPDLDDKLNQQRNYISSDGDWIDFDATVSTSPEQIAVAPGYLQKEWTENGRRFFHYKMDRPILDFYAFLSADYQVKRDAWHPQSENVPIEIYYHKGHEYDLQRMDDGVKDALDYYTKNFSPYQHKQLRILEFPRYQVFAQSFPNTIPFSEAIGFIARVKDKDPKDLDYPYYVTAHEVAHQWWAHQEVAANVQGATFLVETLAQYSALMVMKHRYGDAKMKRFLRYELDMYLRGRSVEQRAELPLYRNENQQYIHYRKGSLAMYDFQDAIGEDNVNKALAEFLRKWAFKGPPYPTSRDLLAEFRAVTPPDYQYLVGDLFETITLFENRAIDATAKDVGGGEWEVTLKASAKKLQADGTGAQKEVPMDDWVDVGVYGEDPDKPLFLEKRKVRNGEWTYTMRVKGKPVKAGIDPVNKLIDRDPEDNLATVTFK